MGKRGTLPSKYKIAEYWRDKLLPNGYPVITDYYEPSCWACGNWIHNEYEGERIRKGDSKSLWNDSIYELERCHIIPRALGGSDTADNLFLMCPHCHKASPDTTDVDYFFDWVMKRTWSDTVDESPIWKARQMIIDYGYDSSEFIDFMRKVYAYEIELDLDFEINTHGFEFSDSTIIYTYANSFMKYKREEGLYGK